MRRIALIVMFALPVASAAEAGLRLNLRFADGATTRPLTVADVGSDIPIQVWATITSSGGINGTGVFSGLHFVNFNIASARQQPGPNGSIDGGLLAPTLVGPFNAAGSQIGALANLTDDGIADVGSDAMAANLGFMQPRSTSPVFSDDPTAIGQTTANGYEFLVATVNFHVDHVPGGPIAGAGTRFDAQIPNWNLDNGNRANWYQKSNQSIGNGLNNGNYTAGDSVVVAVRPASEWVNNGDGNWSNLANWSPSEPNAKSAVANFLATPAQPVTVMLDGDKQAGIINFDSPQSYLLAGAGTLTLNPSGFDAEINVLRGSHTIAAPLAPIRSTTIRVDSGAQLQLTNLQTVSPVIRKTGGGDLSIGPVSYNNNIFLSVFNGALRLTTDPGDSGISNLQLQGEQADGKIVFQASQHIASLTLRSGSSAVNEGHYLHFRSMEIAADTGATLDLGTGAMAVTYPGAIAPLEKFRQLIKSGFNANGTIWDGAGIKSSAARDDAKGLTALGYADNADVQYSNVNGVRFNYDGVGEEVPTRAVLVKYTYVGDADLNGVVDGDDLVALLVGYANPELSPHWSNGDFDYNGVVDGDDLTSLLVAYSQQGGPLGTAAVVAAVPEPATWSLGICGLASLGIVGGMRARRL